MTFADNLARVEDRIAAACRHAARPRSEVRLMAVSKTHPPEAMAEALAAGINLFGESRVQEFESKRAHIPAAAEVHLIGHLQSNKSSRAAELFHAIDTVDSLRLAERLHHATAQLGKTLPILLEIKLSPEPAKAGFDPARPELSELLERLPNLPNLALRGLMTIAPLDDDPHATRTCFRQLHQLRDRLAVAYPVLDFRELSMGMSGDFELAIEEGSTLVRIGTALFGERPAPAP